jgi:hypothetical protein
MICFFANNGSLAAFKKADARSAQILRAKNFFAVAFLLAQIFCWFYTCFFALLFAFVKRFSTLTFTPRLWKTCLQPNCSKEAAQWAIA